MLRILVATFIFQTALVNHVEGSRAETTLYRELLSGYNKLVRPVRNVTDPVVIEMKVHLQQIMTLDGKNQIIELNAWLKYIWKDYRLAWDPAKFEGIESIRFAGGENQIWRPDILLHNSANEAFDSTYKSNEVVYSSGEVNWVPPGIFLATCKMDITYFPFDDQTCFLEFGSWSYPAHLLDLRFSENDDKTAVDLSTYTPSGEWQLLSVPAVRRVAPSNRNGMTFSTVIFYLNLRRKTLYYLFNIVFPSLLISVMTLMGFCLPAHDMSEKIGFQPLEETTILLSLCFFVTIVSEMTPPTSESVPILGMFFSVLTLIVSASTTFTITVLNIRYRQDDNHIMSKTFYQIVLVWLPWLLLMKRPGVLYRKKKEHRLPEEEGIDAAPAPISRYRRTGTTQSADEPETEQLAETFKTGDIAKGGVAIAVAEEWDEDSTPPRPKPLVLEERLNRLASERLSLDRKVGEGILQPRKEIENKGSQKIMERLDTYVAHCIENAGENEGSENAQYMRAVAAHYSRILESVRFLNNQAAEAEDSCDLASYIKLKGNC